MRVPLAVLCRVAVVATLTSAPTFGQACADLLELGTLGGTTSYAYGVSADGEIVVGVADDAAGEGRAFRWTAAGGMQNLGTLGGDYSEARGISADGTIVVGWSFDAAGLGRPVRWLGAGTIEDLGDLGGGAFAYAASADGSVVVGRARDAAGDWRAFRWSVAGGMQDLGTLGPMAWTFAFAVSADGEVVAGTSGGRAFLWTRSTGMRELGTLSGPSSHGFGLSDCGRVVVGSSELLGSAPRPSHAFRWSSAAGLEDLGTLGGRHASAFAATLEGDVIVGAAFTPTSQSRRVFRWSAQEGMREVPVFGSTAEAIDVSADGSVIVGAAFAPHAGATRAFRVRSSVVGESFCRPAVANSAGCAGVLLVEGSPRVGAGLLELRAVDLPIGAFGMFLVSPATALVPGWGGSAGTLCLGGTPGVFGRAGQVMNSRADGAFALSADLTALPTPGGHVSAMPGETWHFQAWYRDANPWATSNLTDAVAVTVQ